MYHIRFFCLGQELIPNVELTCSRFVQLTYNLLRIGPDGEVVAAMDEDGTWHLDRNPNGYSDVSIWYEEDQEEDPVYLAHGF